VSQRQFPIRAATMLAATAGALAPVMDSLARRRRRRQAEDNDDDDNVESKLQILRRRRRRQEREDDDDDDGIAALRAKRRKARQDQDDTDDDADNVGDGLATINRKQSIVGDLGINEIVQDRIDTALSGGGGGGGGDANIVVSQDGDVLTVLTSDIEFAGDSEGFEVETGGISYSSGAGGGLLEDDFSS
jgi:hypothetical protein